MSALSDVEVVDSVSALKSLLDKIDAYSEGKHISLLFLNLHCTEPDFNGSISKVSIYAIPENTFYMVDVLRLREAAFSTTNSQNSSLKATFEHSARLTVLYTVDGPSKTLINKYRVTYDGVETFEVIQSTTQPGEFDRPNND